jgi:hypothetical protein
VPEVRAGIHADLAVVSSETWRTRSLAGPVVYALRPHGDTVRGVEDGVNQKTLVADEVSQLASCEAVIERGLQTFSEVGTALLTIRDQRLYRATHSTFEEYCRERWMFSKTHANRMIEASEIVGNLAPIGAKPTSESQVRPLAGLEPENQRIIWEQAIEESDGGQPTAAKVDEVKTTLIEVIADRRKKWDERQASSMSPASKAKNGYTPEPQEAPLSRKELAEMREIAKKGTEKNHKVFDFRRAIECLSKPQIELQYVASQLVFADLPESDWGGQLRDAEVNLKRLRKLFIEEKSKS